MRRLLYIFSLASLLFSCDSDEPFTGGPSDGGIKAEQILDNYSVTAIAFGIDGTAWVGTLNQGLIRYTPTETIVYNSTNSIINTTSPINDIAVDPDGNIWIATNGLIKFNGTDFTLYNSANSDIPVDLIKSVAADMDGNVWFTSNTSDAGGLVKYDGATFTVYTPSNSDLPDNVAKNIYVDFNNNVWVSTTETLNNASVVKISGNDWTVYSNSALGFTPAGIGQLVVNSSDKVFGIVDYLLGGSLGTRGNKIFSFVPETTENEQFNTMKVVRAITLDASEKLWYVSQWEVGEYNGEAWVIEDSGFTTGDLTTIEQGPQDKMWIGSTDGVWMVEDLFDN